MINVQNQSDVQAFLRFQLEVSQVSPLTEYANRGRLKHLLEWSGSQPFGEMAAIKPAFSSCLESKINQSGALFSASRLMAICKTCRAFLKWAMRKRCV